MERFEKKMRFMCVDPSGEGDDTIHKIFYRTSTQANIRGMVRQRTKYVNGKILPYDSAYHEDLSALDLESMDASLGEPAST